VGLDRGRRARGPGRDSAGAPPDAQELSINIDTGALAARRMLATMAGSATSTLPAR
jgi:hypothetical protein